MQWGSGIQLTLPDSGDRSGGDGGALAATGSRQIDDEQTTAQHLIPSPKSMPLPFLRSCSRMLLPARVTLGGGALTEV
jgi:hypothetical protein